MRLSDLYTRLAEVCEAAAPELGEEQHRPLCEALAATYRHLARLAQEGEVAH